MPEKKTKGNTLEDMFQDIHNGMISGAGKMYAMAQRKGSFTGIRINLPEDKKELKQKLLKVVDELLKDMEKLKI